VVANLLSFWHQATVAHARCAEHGEIVHAGHAGPAELAQDERIAARGEVVHADELTSRSWALDAGDEHDHCQQCPATREVLRLSRPAAVAAPLAAGAVAVAYAPAAVDAGGVDIVRIAPKTSPPV
jgi:hypothetical protein